MAQGASAGSFPTALSELCSAYGTCLSLWGFWPFPELILGLCSVGFPRSHHKHVQAPSLVHLPSSPDQDCSCTKMPPLLGPALLCPLILSEIVLVHRTSMWFLLSYFMALLSWTWHCIPLELCWEVIQMSLLKATTYCPSSSVISQCPLSEP